MNHRDMDALIDAMQAYDRFRTGKREILGGWKIDQDDDVRYAAERSWVKDIFNAETTCWTEERDRYPGFAPRRSKSVRNEELQTGDTTELDSFLASFSK